MPQSTFILQLPKAWPAKVRSAMLPVVSLAKYAAVYTRSWAANSPNARVRGKAEIESLREEVAQLRAEVHLKDARMECLPPHRRPYYPPPVRLEILELRAARGWSLQQTAEAFLVSPKTVVPGQPASTIGTTGALALRFSMRPTPGAGRRKTGGQVHPGSRETGTSNAPADRALAPRGVKANNTWPS